MSETIGRKLGQAREEKHISLEQVSAATRVRLHYLEALERDDLSAIPSAAQARGFLRIYADFLGLNADELVPLARPSEPAASIPDLPAASVQETISTPAPTRPNLLTSLRARFTRRSTPKNILADASRLDEQSAAPEPEFAPARYTEELPAEPAPVVIEEPAAQEAPKPVKRSSGRKTIAAKKPALKKAKTSSKPKAGKKSELKKKIAAMSRPKGGSSSRKPSSSPTRRVSKKMPGRKPKKRA